MSGDVIGIGYIYNTCPCITESVSGEVMSLHLCLWQMLPKLILESIQGVFLFFFFYASLLISNIVLQRFIVCESTLRSYGRTFQICL